MSMNKMFKKVLAVVAAGAMTMGMAMPTFAADEGKTTEAWITKTYNTEVGKAEKFSFTAEQVKTGTGIITTDAVVTMPTISRLLCRRYHLPILKQEQFLREVRLHFRHIQKQESMSIL